jgi:hypothetical protein
VPKALDIFVAGGFDETDPNSLGVEREKIVAFAPMLGAEIARQGHNLITGCQTEVDKLVAEAAAAELARQAGGAKPSLAQRIINYVRRGVTPVTNVGVCIESDVPDWNFGGREPTPPEVVANADVVILLGGFFGTFQAANWARFAGKPILPFAIFGGASREVYGVESRRFDDVYAAFIERIAYDQVLKSMSTEWEQVARSAVSLAEKIVTTPSVFVVMSYAERGQYRDLYTSIKRVCDKYEYVARRVDEANLFKRIVPEIMRQLRQCAFVIADVTEPKPNVFYELGIAEGLRKDIILIAKKDTKMPFDINDFPVIFWDSFTDFEDDLDARVKHIGKWQGRA